MCREAAALIKEQVEGISEDARSGIAGSAFSGYLDAEDVKKRWLVLCHEDLFAMCI